ncbi:MAG: SLC13 family permease [Leptolyngbyaceae cyanobacterium SM1_1_3]|nr:SLC13 family permease [Leptolyngbyaceae cyanobacterium SM1_1_3]NJN02857.1 SLC13 family permease [Leptolyngbyaceae cyanobacterium RM1_1_2]NJO09098.1 SLC13 family permease [Leptolyngbyaceae cyanobacterium SL_1_1]
MAWLLLGLAAFGLSLIAAVGWAMPAALTPLGWQGGLAIAVVVITFVANATTSLPADIIFLGGAAVLFLSGILDEEAALAGFSNSGMITVAVLYMVVVGPQQTGALAWVSQRVLGLPKGERAALWRLMVPVMGLSAFLNNTPVVAMFIPVVSDWCRKLRISPSKLMIPLSYAAIFGGICTLIGTSTNLVVNGLLISSTDLPSMGLLDIAWVGLPCAIAGFVFLTLTQRWLLPNRQSGFNAVDDSRQYTVEMVVAQNSPLAGKTVEQAGLRHLPELYLAEIVRGEQLLPAVSPKEILREHDQLIFVGAVDSIVDLQRLRGLQPATDQSFKLEVPRTERCLIEAVVSNTCPIVGKTIREGQFRTQYNAVVLAVARSGERLQGKLGDVRLQPGDVLLLEAHPNFLEQRRVSRDFYLVNGVPDSEPLRHEKAALAVSILVVMVLLAAFGWLSMLKAAVLAAIAMLVTGCCSPAQALRNIEWSVLLVIGAALAMGQALDATGAAEAIANSFISLAGDNAWVSLVLVYGITTLLTEVITNNAAAALVFPIALSLSQTLGVSFMPFVIAIMVAASASFSTPIGYQTNLMVYGPGGYKFTDFMRIGIPLNLLFWVITVTLTPLIYPF